MNRCSPRAAGPIVPRNVRPISAGSGWENRTPSGVMTTTKSVAVSRRTRSASGCRTAAGSGSSSAATTAGDTASVCAIPSISSAVASSFASSNRRYAATVTPTSTTATSAAWSANSCRARLHRLTLGTRHRTK